MADSTRTQYQTSKNSSGPSLFFDERSYSFFNNISVELIEHVIRQKIKYYAVEEKLTQYDSFYGETKKKVTRQPVEVFGRILFNEPAIQTGQFMDRTYSLDIYFQRERLIQDIGMFPRVGDYIEWDLKFFEITAVTEPQIIHGLPDFKFAFICNCSSVRQGVFEAYKNYGDIDFNNNNDLRK